MPELKDTEVEVMILTDTQKQVILSPLYSKDITVLEKERSKARQATEERCESIIAIYEQEHLHPHKQRLCRFLQSDC